MLDLQDSVGGGLLVELFKAHITKNLKALALAAIEPAIDDAVAKAVAEMEPEIKSQMDAHRGGLMVLLVTHEKQPAKTR